MGIQVSAQMVKELRDRTGAPMMDCKGALQEAGGEVEKAIDVLRTKGLAAAAKRAGRSTSEGTIGQYIHAGGKIGVLLEVNCETDFVARTEDFKALVKDIAMHIAAANPRFVDRQEVGSEVIDKERKIYRQQAAQLDKPEAVIERIVDGKLEKYYAETVLLEQPFVRDSDQTVGDLVAATIGKVGENIKVRRFTRYQLGES